MTIITYLHISWDDSTNKHADPSFDVFFTGVGGVLYPPNSLHHKISNKALFIKLSPNADDIWFNAMALLNNTKTVMTHDKSIEKYITIPDSQNESLWHTNVLEGENDKQLKNVFDYFDLYKYITLKNEK